MAKRFAAVSSLLACVSGQDVFLKAQSKTPEPFQWGPDDESPLDTYVNKPDPHYGWLDTGDRVKMLTGNTGHVLNVTSQKWLDESRAHLEKSGSSVWSHLVTAFVPKELRIRKKAVIYITGDCNENPKPPSATNIDEPLAIDAVAADLGVITVVLNQIPNCHMVYPSDPQKRPRSEDSMIAWAWHQFLQTGDPEWLPRLPMVKAAMAAMRSVQEYTTQSGLAEIDGWAVAGASKRGWTTWLVGAVNCPTCPKVEAIAPIVPIVPNLREGVHHMFRAYNGFTFAFSDYTEVNITTLIDHPNTTELFKIVDPMHYLDRLEKLPKAVLVSSGDEFMMFEWTRNWIDQMKGETHLYIADNAEHSYATGIVGLLRLLSNVCNSVFLGGTRPKYSYNLDAENGLITVQIPEGQPHGKVVLRHAHTLSTKRRDFRFFGLAKKNAKGNYTCPVPIPGFPLNLLGSEVCFQPIIWEGTTLKETVPGVYVAKIRKPIWGWTGAYVEMYFPSDTGLKQEYQVTTPGMVWPQTLPYDDCHEETCVGRLV